MPIQATTKRKQSVNKVHPIEPTIDFENYISSQTKQAIEQDADLEWALKEVSELNVTNMSKEEDYKNLLENRK